MPTRPLRLWPGVVAAVLLVAIRYIAPAISAEAGPVGLFGGLILAVIIVAWWLLFSRAAWFDRLGMLVLMAVAVAAVSRFVHPSVAGGMMGFLLPVYAMPVLAAALVAGLTISRTASATRRRIVTAAGIVLAAGAFLLVRTDGMLGAGGEFHWRWTPTAEERLLASEDPSDVLAPGIAPTPAAAPTPAGAAGAGAAPSATPAVPSSTTPPVAAAATGPAAPVAPVSAPEWPGFRGAHRDGVIHGVRIDTDWVASPPTTVWRRAIGPGWSSFAVHGDLIYTQEQRGDEEIVACYRLSTGAPVWRHRDPVRFWESNGGAGPRGTPTLGDGRVYSFGATGILNALDAETGRRLWSRQAAVETDATLPMWGFSSSPLVVHDVVIVAASGRLVAYEAATGRPRWMGPARGGSYSSPHLVTAGAVPQVVLLSGPGAIGVSPVDGMVLWEHAWSQSTPIVQPGVTSNGDILINSIAASGGLGLRRLGVTGSAGAWTVEERWTSSGLKPYFNDFVVHKGHAYGFDGTILSCINLEDGARKWKGGRYGGGQLVLLADQDALLVVSEEGELALVSATPDGFRELARAPGLEGKTWNHPVVTGNILLLRNGEEMVALRLTAAIR